MLVRLNGSSICSPSGVVLRKRDHTYFTENFCYTILGKWFPFVRERAHSCQNNKHKQIQNQNAKAFQHLLVSNKKKLTFSVCRNNSLFNS